MTEPMTYPHGLTVDGGRYRLEVLLRGRPREGLWRAVRLRPEAGNVLVTMRILRYSPKLDAALRFSAPGIPEPLYVGPPDKFADEDEHVRQGHLCVVDEQPAGTDLTNAGLLTADETIELGISLCDVIVKWAISRDGLVTRGLRPETIFLNGPVGQRAYSGATPRTFFLLGNDAAPSPYSRLDFDPPAASIFEFPPSDALFTIAAILWYACTATHPYTIQGADTYQNIWTDRRAPFVGPKILADILEGALVAEPSHRLALDDFRARLVGIRG